MLLFAHTTALIKVKIWLLPWLKSTFDYTRCYWSNPPMSWIFAADYASHTNCLIFMHYFTIYYWTTASHQIWSPTSLLKMHISPPHWYSPYKLETRRKGESEKEKGKSGKKWGKSWTLGPYCATSCFYGPHAFFFIEAHMHYWEWLLLWLYWNTSICFSKYNVIRHLFL